MSALEGSLLREVAKTQHDKTIQAVRDAVDEIPTRSPPPRGSAYGDKERSAKEFKADLVAKLREMRDIE